MMTKKNRITAVFLAIMVLIVMLSSAFFIAAEADHDCVGKGCPVCYQINVCQNTLRNLSLAVCAAVFAAAFTHTLCRNFSSCTNIASSHTLIALKVKLSD